MVYTQQSLPSKGVGMKGLWLGITPDRTFNILDVSSLTLTVLSLYYSVSVSPLLALYVFSVIINAVPLQQVKRDDSALCCCEYINEDKERSHLLATLCNCEAIDEAFERWFNDSTYWIVLNECILNIAYLVIVMYCTSIYKNNYYVKCCLRIAVCSCFLTWMI